MMSKPTRVSDGDKKPHRLKATHSRAAAPNNSGKGDASLQKLKRFSHPPGRLLTPLLHAALSALIVKSAAGQTLDRGGPEQISSALWMSYKQQNRKIKQFFFWKEEAVYFTPNMTSLYFSL